MTQTDQAQSSSSFVDAKCSKCGFTGHLVTQCPVFNCSFCKQPGHSSLTCPKVLQHPLMTPNPTIKAPNLRTSLHQLRWRNKLLYTRVIVKRYLRFSLAASFLHLDALVYYILDHVCHM